LLHEIEVETLTELGLSGRQARIFLDLSKYKTSTARALSIASKLARQDTYRVLDELQKLGLIERQISVPTKFVAIPIHDALSILLNRKVKQTSSLKSKTKTLINQLKGQNVRTVEDEEPKLFLIPEGETAVLKIREAVETAQKSIDIVTSTHNLSQGMYFVIEDLKRALGRGVKIRCLAEVLESKDKQLEMCRPLEDSSSFEARLTPDHLMTRFCIYDRKRFSGVLSSSKSFAKSSYLWSNCASIVEEFQDYFELMWLNATILHRNKIITA
jgi:sugar-specific transcriptional regulator TrmB